ncbi:unnamed protein product [Rhodiola kirilowii]
MVAMDNYINRKSSARRIVNGHPNIMNNYTVSELGNQKSSNLLGSPGLMQDTGFAVDWSSDEQRILDEGLLKFANESAVMKYVKIANLLMDKTARDVATRCNWMKTKRRKQNQPAADKKMTTWKEVPSKENMAPYNGTHNMNHTKQLPHEVYQGPFQNLLQENAQLFSIIDGNFSAFKLQENLDLFRHARNNILTILNNMTDLRGAISPMPPLPVSINEDLANIILQDPTQANMFGFSNDSFQI